MAGGRNYEGRIKMRGGQDLITKYANAEAFESESAFARFLHKIEPTRSVNGWRSAIKRWKTDGGQITYTKWNGHKYSKDRQQDIAVPHAIKAPTNYKKYYDEARDVYLTFIEQANQIIEIDGETHREMKKKYSDEGGRFTVAQMAQQFGFPILWMQDYIKEIGRAHV